MKKRKSEILQNYYTAPPMLMLAAVKAVDFSTDIDVLVPTTEDGLGWQQIHQGLDSVWVGFTPVMVNMEKLNLKNILCGGRNDSGYKNFIENVFFGASGPFTRKDSILPEKDHVHFLDMINDLRKKRHEHSATIQKIMREDLSGINAAIIKTPLQEISTLDKAMYYLLRWARRSHISQTCPELAGLVADLAGCNPYNIVNSLHKREQGRKQVSSGYVASVKGISGTGQYKSVLYSESLINLVKRICWEFGLHYNTSRVFCDVENTFKLWAMRLSCLKNATSALIPTMTEEDYTYLISSVEKSRETSGFLQAIRGPDTRGVASARRPNITEDYEKLKESFCKHLDKAEKLKNQIKTQIGNCDDQSRSNIISFGQRTDMNLTDIARWQLLQIHATLLIKRSSSLQKAAEALVGTCIALGTEANQGDLEFLRSSLKKTEDKLNRLNTHYNNLKPKSNSSNHSSAMEGSSDEDNEGGSEATSPHTPATSPPTPATSPPTPPMSARTLAITSAHSRSQKTSVITGKKRTATSDAEEPPKKEFRYRCRL
eukprot:GHVO01066033.1.p1 GENE.GHVO01066033.1~~GHVO01066033.1.p1  ORF type:complete len:543 (+),score=43.09 GHVO01066033.1:34-1662(+)